MKKRTRQLTAQWAMAAQRLARKLGGTHRDQKQVLDPLCAFKELSSEGLGGEPTAPGSQVTTGLPSKEFYGIYLNLGQKGEGRQRQARGRWWPWALSDLGKKDKLPPPPLKILPPADD